MEPPAPFVPQPEGAVIRLQEGRGPLDHALQEHRDVPLAGHLGRDSPQCLQGLDVTDRRLCGADLRRYVENQHEPRSPAVPRDAHAQDLGREHAPVVALVAPAPRSPEEALGGDLGPDPAHEFGPVRLGYQVPGRQVNRLVRRVAVLLAPRLVHREYAQRQGIVHQQWIRCGREARGVRTIQRDRSLHAVPLLYCEGSKVAR